MAKYKIERREYQYGTWTIEAESREDAEEKWEAMKDRGEVDYSFMEVYDADETITEV